MPLEVSNGQNDKEVSADKQRRSEEEPGENSRAEKCSDLS